METNRRALIGATAALAGASALNTVAIVAAKAAPAEADPIFAAIERCRWGASHHYACIDRADELEQAYLRAKRAARTAKSRLRDQYETFEAIREEGCDAESDTRDEMLSTVPTTPQGALALLSYLEESIATNSVTADLFESPQSREIIATMRKYFERAVQS